MNGNRTAEQYAEAAAESAQAAHEKAREIADAALRMEQSASRMERRIDDFQRDLRKLQGQVAVGFANLKKEKPRHELQSFSDTEWEDSPTGTHKIKKVRRAEWETWAKEKELSVDARRWRKALNTSGKIALLIVMAVVGALIRHLWR